MPASVKGRRRSPYHMSPIRPPWPPAPPMTSRSVVVHGETAAASTVFAPGIRASVDQRRPPRENTCGCSEPGAPRTWTRIASPTWAWRIGVTGSPWACEENCIGPAGRGAERVVHERGPVDLRRVGHGVRPDHGVVVEQHEREVPVALAAGQLHVHLGADVAREARAGIAELRALRGHHERAVQAAGARVRVAEVGDHRAADLLRVGEVAVGPLLARSHGLLGVVAGVDARRGRRAGELVHVERGPRVRPLVAERDGDALARRGVEHERLGRRPAGLHVGRLGGGDEHGARALLAAGVGQVDGRDLEPARRRVGRAGLPGRGDHRRAPAGALRARPGRRPRSCPGAAAGRPCGPAAPA